MRSRRAWRRPSGIGPGRAHSPGYERDLRSELPVVNRNGFLIAGALLRTDPLQVDASEGGRNVASAPVGEGVVVDALDHREALDVTDFVLQRQATALEQFAQAAPVMIPLQTARSSSIATPPGRSKESAISSRRTSSSSFSASASWAMVFSIIGFGSGLTVCLALVSRLILYGDRQKAPAS